MEAGKVAEFARAVRDPADVYTDPEAAAAAGHDRVPAPPTFQRTSFFPRYRPAGIDHEFGFDLGFDREYVLHGEQRYRYDRPLYVGDRLTGETALADAFVREGAGGGEMTFAVFRTEFRDADGERALTAWNTRIETDGAVADGERDAPRGTVPTRGDAGLREGDLGPTTTVGPLDRRRFVRYAGASGDFNPVHYDEPYATGAGHPSVFAQGMFSAGVLSRVVREWVGLDALRTYRTRFVSRAFPGDTLRGRGRVADVTDGTATLALELVADGGDVVVEGEATATV